jgi:predicted PurR-regulated permease PerM
LGNSYYKLNDIPNSIYYFEKALKLSPNDKDILNNLTYSQNMLIDKIDLLPSNQLSDFFNYISDFFSIKQWLIIGTIFLYFFLILFVIYFFKRDSNTKKKYFTLSSTFFLPHHYFYINRCHKI